MCAAAVLLSSKIELDKVDELNDAGSFEEAHTLAEKVANVDASAAVKWRLARAKFQLSTNRDGIKADEAQAPQRGVRTSRGGKAARRGEPRCMEVVRNILQEQQSAIGTKAKIACLLKVKERWLKATELNPQDASAWHLLGRLTYGIQHLGWLQQKVIASIFGKLPDCSMSSRMSTFSAPKI